MGIMGLGFIRHIVVVKGPKSEVGGLGKDFMMQESSLGWTMTKPVCSIP